MNEKQSKKMKNRPKNPQKAHAKKPKAKTSKADVKLVHKPGMPTVRVQGNVMYIMGADNRKFSVPWRMVFTIVLIFIVALGSALTYAHIQTTRGQIIRERNALIAARDANASLRAQVTERFTNEEIERIATGRLGMARPEPAQIFYIHVPLRDTVLLNIDENMFEEHNFFLQDIRDFMTGLINRIFGG